MGTFFFDSCEKETITNYCLTLLTLCVFLYIRVDVHWKARVYFFGYIQIFLENLE